jgi:hypothetical protein
LEEWKDCKKALEMSALQEGFKFILLLDSQPHIPDGGGYVDMMVAAGGIKPPCVTLTRLEYSEKQEETLKHWT